MAKYLLNIRHQPNRNNLEDEKITTLLSGELYLFGRIISK